MARKCSVCSHVSRGAIDLALATGGSFRTIAAQHALSASAVGNHSRLHLARALACPAPDPVLAELQGAIETKRSIELAINATIRDHVAYDLARIEELIGVSMAKGQHGAVTALMRTKWLILSRSGIATETERPLNSSPEDIDPAEAKARGFEKAADEVHRVLMSFRRDATIHPTRSILHDAWPFAENDVAE